MALTGYCKYCKTRYPKTADKNEKSDFLFNRPALGSYLDFHMTDHKCYFGCLCSNWKFEPNVPSQRLSYFFKNVSNLTNTRSLVHFAAAYKNEYINRSIEPNHFPEYLERYNSRNRLNLKLDANFSLITFISINDLTSWINRNNEDCVKEFAILLLKLKGLGSLAGNKEAEKKELGPLVLSTVEHIITNGSVFEKIEMVKLVLRYRNQLLTPGFDTSFAAVPNDIHGDQLELPTWCHVKHIQPELQVLKKENTTRKKLKKQVKKIFIGLQFPKTLCDKYYMPTVLEEGFKGDFTPYPKYLGEKTQHPVGIAKGIPKLTKSHLFKYYELIHPPHTENISIKFFDQNQIEFEFFCSQNENFSIENIMSECVINREEYKDIFFDAQKLTSPESKIDFSEKEKLHLKQWCNNFKQTP